MQRLAALITAALGAALAFPAGAQRHEAPAGDCEIVRIGEDGSVGRSARSIHRAERRGRSVRASASARSTSSTSGRSSVRVSSSSTSSVSGGGRSRARAVSSHTDALGRTVTTTSDENGCSVTIDGRRSTGED